MPLHYIIFQTGYGNREAGQQRSEWQKSSVTSQWSNLQYGQNNMTLIMKTIWKKKVFEFLLDKPFSRAAFLTCLLPKKFIKNFSSISVTKNK